MLFLIDGMIEGVEWICDIVDVLKCFLVVDKMMLEQVSFNEVVECVVCWVVQSVLVCFVVDIDLLLNLICLGFFGQLQQVVMNFVQNVCDVMINQLELCFKIIGCVENGLVFISFIDNGLGIFEEYFGCLFELFFIIKLVG